MPMTSTISPRPLPIWLKFAGSAFAIGHLLAIGLYALAAESGPWPYNAGNSPSPGPQFATSLTWGFGYPYYLRPLRLTNDYHFVSNRPAEFAVYFQVHLKNQLGEVRTLKFPDEKANFWVRHRQEILAQHLVPDQRLPPRGNRRLPGLGQEVPTVEVWVRDGEATLRLKQVDENDESLRNAEVDHPTEKAKALVRSYLRYLSREHKADSAELVRHSRPMVLPMDTMPHMFMPRPAELFQELKSHFGEYRRE